METLRFHTVPLILLLSIFSSSFLTATLASKSYFNRTSFPSTFTWGAAASAYQYEGAAFEDGKGPSIWDTFTHLTPPKILNGSNGDVAVDFYHRYKGDVQLMKQVGLNAYRMSISWPRILPKGKLSGGVNKKGIAFYNNVFNELLANGITPFVTIFHWDVPQALEDKYKGFLSPLIVDDYKDFAELCFKEFGDRVKNWITLNEPYVFTIGGYDAGVLAPGRCSDRARCAQGNSATEPYIVAHNLLLSHSAAIKLYRDKYQKKQKGIIGITQATQWMTPYSNSKNDVQAAQRALEFMVGWFQEPVTYGRYPKIMETTAGKRIPKFTKKESELLKGSFDFLGVNYYTGSYIAHADSPIGVSTSSDSKTRAVSTNSKGVALGAPTGVTTFFVYPRGFYNMLVYIKKKYSDPTIYITENGYGSLDNTTLKEEVNDRARVNFYNVHLQALREAIKDGVNIKGFFGWSFLDNLEWNSGYTIRFGIVYIDYKNGLKRVLKASALWFKRFLLKN